ncbi:MAG: protein translocase subunit SecD [Elusimicrobia bacterium]|nr:protein translocase subunit SecD [Elusimicrobiota bacterium]
MTKMQTKWALVLALVALAIAMVYPSYNWYAMNSAQRDRLEAARMRPSHLLNLGLDLRGGTHLLMELQVQKLPPDADINDALQRAIEIIRNRVDALGVASPLIAREGDRDIIVQLPGIKNVQAAKDIIGTTALLEFRMVDDSQAARDAAGKIYEKYGDPFGGGTVLSTGAAAMLPAGDVLVRGRGSEFYVCRDTVPLTGSLLDTAHVTTGENGLPVVDFKWKPEGGRVFGELTSANVGKNMAIVLDGVVQSAPVIHGPIRGGSGIIEGNFTMDEARKLAIVLRAGSLPAPLKIIEERTIGASLGADSIRAGMKAFGIGLGIVCLFMIVYYNVGGAIADMALLLNLLFTVALMSYFGATLTMPGIAGLLLTMGMAVDANVLIFERMREEMRLGKPTRIVIDVGYSKAFTAILDGHITTLIGAAFLFQFGTGPVKGFAVTLSLGVAASLFTSVVVTHMVFDSLLGSGSTELIKV